VGLQATRRVDPLLEERLVLHCLVDASKHTARHARPRLKITVVVDGSLRVDPKVVALDVEEPSGKVSPLVWPTPSSGATVATTAAGTAGARPSSKQEQHAHMGAHSGTNDATIVVCEQRCSARQLRLFSVHECTAEGPQGEWSAQKVGDEWNCSRQRLAAAAVVGGAGHGQACRGRQCHSITGRQRRGGGTDQCA